MADSSFSPLKLLATDHEDLKVLSAHLQDGLVSLSSMNYDRDNSRLTCLVNRFCWEFLEKGEEEKIYYRVHTGLCIHHVQGVHLRGFTQLSSQRIFNILSLTLNPEGALTLHLLCSGDHEICITVNNLYCQFADLDHPWPTSKKPTHIHEHLQALHI